MKQYMAEYRGEHSVPLMTREQKVQEAKAAFQRETEYRGSRENSIGKNAFFVKESTMEREDLDMEETAGWRVKWHFALLRFFTALTLLLLLIGAFSRQFSYKGFNQSYLENIMNDDSHWQTLETAVQKIYIKVIPSSP